MKLKITVDGKQYEVDVEVAEAEPTAAPVTTSRAAPSAPRSAPSGGSNNTKPTSNVSDDKACNSPLAGTVSQIKVTAGQEVKKDEEVLVLEAMKMLTSITSPNDGKVKTVHVEAGESVKQGQLLVEFE